jgi:ribosomal-protein-alanine N-acetyltransferase
MIEIVNIDNENDLLAIQVIYNDLIKQKKELKKEIEENPYKRLFCYKQDNRVVGFIEISDIYDRYEVDYIYVLEDYRNNHIASLLMERIISLGLEEKIENITLEVRVDNVPAINLYKKYNFEECAIRKGYYNGVDGILMKKEMI